MQFQVQEGVTVITVTQIVKVSIMIQNSSQSVIKILLFSIQ